MEDKDKYKPANDLVCAINGHIYISCASFRGQYLKSADQMSEQAVILGFEFH